MHDEIETLCFEAPVRITQQKTLKPRHVRDFLNEILSKPTSEVTEQRKEIQAKRPKKNRATGFQASYVVY